jgi:hypothetical protein
MEEKFYNSEADSYLEGIFLPVVLRKGPADVQEVLVPHSLTMLAREILIKL